jgi:hypothetical protein
MLYKYNFFIYIMNVHNVDENITFELYDSSSNDGFEQELDDLINSIHDSANSIVTESNNYNVNFTIKQLLVICDYYGLSKMLKSNKNNKEYIVNVLVLFEKDYANQDIVSKRRNMWYFMAELKNDKFMKKYIIW